ncbi:hypothetical protein C6N75_03490 [Streptomyces solincola]|uniref:Uncharacterized protein n=1 Tax=Streptomyces solincola TaxID=2100817 RepID=A0A2S9Q1N1_9ACTN|nr:hypothetical protein [Streptomyces solincola]PRH80579.1 hypothetical protein C6N75_03490 [Streptomyces solincola]
MTEAEGITAWRERALLRLVEARRAGDLDTAKEIVHELVEVHVALGERRTGTSEEQRTYLMARSTRTPLPELAEVGIDTNEWPLPPSSPMRAEPLPASPDTEQRISSLFAAAGPLGDHRPPRPRYEARHRPQDGHRHRNEPLDWAVWDTDTDLPVTYHPDQELAEYQADGASERYARKFGRRRETT